MNRTQIAIGIFALGVVGLGAYWGWTTSHAVVPNGASQSDGNDPLQQESSEASGSATKSRPVAQQQATDRLKSADVAVAAQQALESAERGVETGDLAALRKLRAQLDTRGKLLPDKDDDALDLAIACLAEEPDAKEDAEEFFQLQPATALHIQVKRVCLGE